MHVPEVERWTQARHLSEVEATARDLAALMLDVHPKEIEVEDVTITLPESVQHRLAEAGRLRKQAAEANHAAGQASRQAARELKDDGLTVRDIGEALGISYQRAHQLVSH